MKLYDIDPGPEAPELVRAIIEIPKNSTNKYEYDGELDLFRSQGELPSWHEPELVQAWSSWPTAAEISASWSNPHSAPHADDFRAHFSARSISPMSARFRDIRQLA